MFTHAEIARYVQHRALPPGMVRHSISKFIGAYVIALTVNLIVLALLLPLLVLVYPITGICLSRYIGRRIIWSTLYATIGNVSTLKLKFIMSWPLAAPHFICRAFVAKFF